PRRVALPTYPFERQKYWIERELDDSGKLQAKDRLSENSNIENWFYVPSWERAAFQAEIDGELSQNEILWLIIADRFGVGAGFKRKLDEMSAVVEVAHFGEKFDHRSDGIYEVNPSAVDDYLNLFRRLKGKLRKALNIVHLGCLTRNENQTSHSRSEDNQNFGFYSLLYVAQAIGELNSSIPIKIGIISNRMHEVTGEETLQPEMATALGPCGVIPKEFPNVTCFNIDLPENKAVGDLPNETIIKILSEFTGTGGSQVVAYRGNYRWKRKYERVKLSRPTLSEAPNGKIEIKRLRRGGVYLITGGTGGIGLTIAKYLAGACQPKIVLTKKTKFPEKSSWRELLTAKDTSAPVARTIQQLLDIEQMGAEIEVFVAEASDKEQMQKVLDETVKKYKAINGVIHAAGIVRAGLIQTKTKEVADSVLLPKVHGTMILFELLREIDLDFLVLFSSITSIITPYAESDYSAANSFLDAFTYFSNAQKRFHTLTINWPGWKEVGQLAELKALPGVESWKEEALKRAILTKDGLEAFKRALNSDFKQVVVSPEDLNHLLAQSQEFIDPLQYLSLRQDSTKAVPFNRGRQDGKDQPTNEVEATVARIWSEVFGFDRIGIHEEFSSLGGHSLLAMQIVSKIRFSYQIDFTLREFFERPTVAQLSSTLRARIVAEIEGLSDEEARELISNR
ncbi:MAG TPA: SDR family NAD(P)-dependent oxidoreductase, partial [Nitrososphaera sp.]|nr:SDR family NAD(P)-dependent oxidoreductase [Nitrososphaera sp.]